MLRGIAPLFYVLSGKNQRVICSFSRSLRENEPKEGRYPQGPLQRGMQKIFRRDRRKILGFGIAGRRDEFFIGWRSDNEVNLNNLYHWKHRGGWGRGATREIDTDLPDYIRVGGKR